MAPDNGSIVITSNTFTDNHIGAWIGSGLIDLTGDLTPGTPNVFIGGDTALRFEPASSGTSFTGLELVNNTIGTTQFIGQSRYYIELLNGAFFAPGNPTIIDGTQATYDFVNGGLMTAAQLAAIESKINDYDDDNTLGQIFAGYTPRNNTHVFGEDMSFKFPWGRAGIIITGMPYIPGQRMITRTLTPQQLAGLEPAASDDDDDEENRRRGTSIKAPCWSRAIGMLGGGNVVDMDMYQGDDTSAAAAARICRGAI